MEQGFKNTFQLYTPASRYLTGAVDMLGKLMPTAKKIAIVNEKDAFFRHPSRTPSSVCRRQRVSGRCL